MNPLTLPNGMDYGTGPNGERICRGARMGRCNNMPDDTKAEIKLRLVRLRWVDGDYDQGGAYWGGGSNDNIYWATADNDVNVNVFVRAPSRLDAREKVLELLPNAKFYN